MINNGFALEYRFDRSGLSVKRKRRFCFPKETIYARQEITMMFNLFGNFCVFQYPPMIFLIIFVFVAKRNKSASINSLGS